MKMDEIIPGEKLVMGSTIKVYVSKLERLKKNGLLHYFDEVYGGDYDLKPREKAFLRAFGSTSKDKCVMIGDNYLKDFCGALNVGSNALHFNPSSDFTRGKQMIKRISEIKERY